MATKSFQKEFILNKDFAESLVKALDNSRKVDVKMNKDYRYVTDPEKIHSELDGIFVKL